MAMIVIIIVVVLTLVVIVIIVIAITVAIVFDWRDSCPDLRYRKLSYLRGPWCIDRWCQTEQPQIKGMVSHVDVFTDTDETSGK